MNVQYANHSTTVLGAGISRRTALRGLGGAGLAAALGVAVAGRAAADHIRQAPMADPAAVIAAYVAAANAHDLDAILALYADDAVHVFLPTPDGSAGVCLGKDQFRLWYEQSIKDADLIELVADSLTVDGDRATFAVRIASGPWQALGLETLEATEEAVMVDGRIASHVAMLTPDSVRQLLVARGTIPTSPAEGDSDQSAHRGHSAR